MRFYRSIVLTNYNWTVSKNNQRQISGEKPTKETVIPNVDINTTKEKHGKSDQRTNLLGLTWNQTIFWLIPQRVLGEWMERKKWSDVNFPLMQSINKRSQYYWQQESNITNKNKHTLVRLWWYLRLQGYSFTDMCIRK